MKSNDKPIISVKEARKILGDSAVGMSDNEISEVIITLDLMAVDALEKAKHRLAVKKDARAMAELIYDIYQDKKRSNPAP